MASSIANKISTYLLGGMSVEKSSTSVSARSTAFMPLVQSRLSQNMQFTWVTHLFLKFALDVDIVVLAAVEELSRSFCPRTEKCKRKQRIGYWCGSLSAQKIDNNVRQDVNFASINASSNVLAQTLAFLYRTNGRLLTLACWTNVGKMSIPANRAEC